MRKNEKYWKLIFSFEDGLCLLETLKHPADVRGYLEE